MKRALLLVLGLAAVVAAQPASLNLNGHGGYLVVQDEGSNLTRRSTIDFTGAGVTCIDTGAKTSCSIAGGGGGASQSPLSITLGSP